jgi:glycosyltransferase involved in cell wall biosynthesis
VRISWYSNVPWAATGYGTQTLEVCSRLKADGHEVAVIANWGLHGSSIDWEGLPVFPAGTDLYSNDIAPAHHTVWGGDWLITLYDVWPLKRSYFPDQRVASWVPVDHQPAPAEVVKWCKTVRPIAMSRFGERMLKAEGIDPTYIPHSINTKVFRPRGKAMRTRLEVPDDAFVVMISAANKGVTPPRKAWPEMFMAASFFMRDHPDAYLYVHTDRVGIGGLDLQLLAKACGIPQDRLRWADAYALAAGRITQDDLSAMYSAADVLLASSMGEGFGIPVMEAQASGTPVIVSDFSAQPELSASGWLVKGQPYWDPAQAAFFFTPFVSEIIARLRNAYAARDDSTIVDAAIAKAAQYDSDLVFARYWRPFIRELEADLSPPPNRAARRARKAHKPQKVAA